MTIEEQYKKWLEEHEYYYKTKNSYYKTRAELKAEIESFSKDLNPFFGNDDIELRRLEKLKKDLYEHDESDEFFEGGYKLKDKYAIDDVKRYENFYICGEDLQDAFEAGFKAALESKDD